MRKFNDGLASEQVFLLTGTIEACFPDTIFHNTMLMPFQAA